MGGMAGSIEYTPIEYSSRVVYGENYLVIHCLWINITGKGYGRSQNVFVNRKLPHITAEKYSTLAQKN